MISIGVPAIRIISSYFVFEGFCLISQTGFQSFGKGERFTKNNCQRKCKREII